ncbi:MAG: Tll0287-like domain-containing protein [Nitrospiraceae bacterium]
MGWTLSLTMGLVMVFSSFSMVGRAADLPGIAPETVTDYIHAVIEADRTFYTIHVVERLQQQGGAPAAENWRTQQKTLPLPAQFLAEASDLSAITGARVRYRLISLWPINPKNGPDDELERKGLEAVREHPERSTTSIVKVGNQTYFRAIYADRAVSQSCAGCHNTHPHSPKKDFKMGDVMGGLVITIPLEK